MRKATERQVVKIYLTAAEQGQIRQGPSGVRSLRMSEDMKRELAKEALSSAIDAYVSYKRAKFLSEFRSILREELDDVKRDLSELTEEIKGLVEELKSWFPLR